MLVACVARTRRSDYDGQSLLALYARKRFNIDFRPTHTVRMERIGYVYDTHALVCSHIFVAECVAPR